MDSNERRRPQRLRAGDEDGFSLMELMIVLMIMSILGTIAVGAYLSMRDQGEVSAAEINVREARSATELYYAHHESYLGMTAAQLLTLDAGVQLSKEPVIAADGRSYCLESTHNGRPTTAALEPGHNVHSLIGPSGDVVPGPCPASL
jgi:prepilin-type N-terminal cleavage/methylation domain-containing protein